MNRYEREKGLFKEKNWNDCLWVELCNLKDTRRHKIGGKDGGFRKVACFFYKFPLILHGNKTVFHGWGFELARWGWIDERNFLWSCGPNRWRWGGAHTFWCKISKTLSYLRFCHWSLNGPSSSFEQRFKRLLLCRSRIKVYFYNLYKNTKIMSVCMHKG